MSGMAKPTYDPDKIALVRLERGCSDRTARRFLTASEAGKAVPRKAFGPERKVSDEDFLAVLRRFRKAELDREQAATILGMSLTSWHRYRRRIEPMLRPDA